MNTIYTNKLNEEQLEKVLELVKICQENDGTFKLPYLSNILNFDENMPAFFMAYDEEKMIGMLSVYADDENAEISLYVHPDYRRRGIAKNLYRLFLEKIKNYPIKAISFICERKFLNENPKLIENWDLEEDEDTEFQLNRDRKLYEVENIENIDISIPKEEELRDIAKIKVEGFESSEEISFKYLKEALEDENSILYCLKKDGEIVGTCAVDISLDSNYIYSLVIAEKYRGQGLGSYFMKNIINELIAMNGKRFEIGVDCDNLIAKNMYEKLGFECVTEVVYLDKDF